MRLPKSDTRAMRVLRVLVASDAITVEQGIALHGQWNATLGEIERLYQKLVTDGCAVLLHDGRFEATRQACESLLPSSPRAGTPAPAPTRPNLLTARPYDPRRYGMSSRGLRAGSNDHLSWPSLYSSKNPPTHPKEQQ
ncbi:MAG: hypothetical protein ACXWVD_00570 [Telluria sp.]